MPEPDDQHAMPAEDDDETAAGEAADDDLSTVEPAVDDPQPLTKAQKAAVALVAHMSSADRDRHSARAWRRRGLLAGIIVFVGLVVLVFTGIPLIIWYTGSGFVGADQVELMHFLLTYHGWISLAHIVGAVLMVAGLSGFSLALTRFQHAYALLPPVKGAPRMKPFWAQVMTLLLLAIVLVGGLIGVLLPDRPSEEIVQRQTMDAAQLQGTGSYLDDGIWRMGDLTEQPDLPRLPEFLQEYEAAYDLHVVALPFVIALLGLAFLFPVSRLQRMRLDPPGEDFPQAESQALIDRHLPAHARIMAHDSAPTILDGTVLANALRQSVQAEIRDIVSTGMQPHLVSVQVGDDTASALYVRNQSRACRAAGIRYTRMHLDAGTPEAEILTHLYSLNANPAITGIILQMPMPAGISARRLQRAIAPALDVEGVTPKNLGNLLLGREKMVPCTPAAVMKLLEAAEVSLEGAEVCIVGHSEIVGKPVAMLLLDRLATVTVCHIATRNLAWHTSRADVLITAVGKPGLITPEHVKDGAVVIDVGISTVPKDPTLGEKGGMKIVGDVCFEAVAPKTRAISPVPGGVGPVTTAMLLCNVVTAARQRLER